MNTKGAWAAFTVAALLLGACGQATPGTGQSSATPALTPATAQQLTAVGAQIFPYIPQFQFYATCIDFKENGAAPPGGHDYSACPITDALRARLQATQANFCPCEQNPSSGSGGDFDFARGGRVLLAGTEICLGRLQAGTQGIRDRAGGIVMSSRRCRGGLVGVVAG